MNEKLPPDPPTKPEGKVTVLEIIFKTIGILIIGAIGLTVLVFGTCVLLMR